MENKERETLGEFLQQDAEYSKADMEKRVQNIQKTFRLLMIIVGSMIVLLVIFGILFGGKA